jgi:nitronate monooxygenase
MLRTRLTELFGIEYPIMSAPMAQHSGGTLAAAVSSAGGFGTFGGINPPGGEHWVRDQIAFTRSKADKPFGVGFITPFLPVFESQFQAALDGRASAIVFSFSDPLPYLRRVKDAGPLAICQVQTLELARMAVDAGADVLIAQGNEAGGHTGTMTLLPLLTSVLDAYPNMPILAAGGITSPRALAAVLSAGADGAMLGTAFLATPEAVEVTDAHKQRIVASDGQDTVYTPIYDLLGIAPWPAGIAGRVYRNEFAREWLGREEELRERRDEIAPRLRDAEQRGDLERTAVYYGQGAGAIDAVRPAAEVLRVICEGAERLLRERAGGLLS